MRVRSFLLFLGTPLMIACSGDTFAPGLQASAGNGGASGTPSGGSSGTAGAGGARAGAGGSDAGAGGADAGAGGSDAGAGGSDAGAGGSDAGAGGSDAGAGGADAGAGGASAGAAGLGGNGAGAGGASAGAAGAPGGGGQGGGGPVDCPILYVASDGENGELRGCSPGKPLATITAALARAEARKSEIVPVSTVRICAGAYTEPGSLVLNLPVSLEGSYICGNGKFNAPAADARESIVRTKNAPILTITDSKVTEQTRVQNLVFDASATVSAATNAAVIVEKNAACTLTDCSMVAGKGDDNVIGSAGLIVRGGGVAKVTGSTLRGGVGALSGDAKNPVLSTSVGSAGLYVGESAGAVTLVETDVVGGAGDAVALGVGSAGIAFRGPTLTLSGSTIEAGTGKLIGDAPKEGLGAVRSVGIDAGGLGPGELTVSDSTIQGGRAEGEEVSRTAGIRVRNTNLTLDRVRVYGGDATKQNPGEKVVGRSFGLKAIDSTITVGNAILHGGGADSAGNSTGGTTYTRSVDLEKSSLDATFVTFLAGRSTGNSVAVQLNGLENQMKLKSSLLVAQVADTYGIFGVDVCPSPSTQIANKPLLDHVVFVQPVTSGTGHLYQGDGSCGFTDAVTGLTNLGFQVDSVHQVVAPSGIGGDFNTTLEVVGCSTNEACPVEFFQGYAKDDAGRAPTLLGVGLRPACDLPLEVLKSAEAPASLQVDLASELRVKPTTLGAFRSFCLL